MKDTHFLLVLSAVVLSAFAVSCGTAETPQNTPATEQPTEKISTTVTTVPTTETTAPVQTASPESETPQQKITVPETSAPSETPAVKENFSETVPQETTPETETFYEISQPIETEVSVPTADSDWKSAYITYIENYLSQNENVQNSAMFYLFDIDGNNIPELHIQSGFVYAGSVLLTYNPSKNSISELTGKEGSSIKFTKGKTNFNYTGGYAGSYYDTVYQLENGSFLPLASGWYSVEDFSDPPVDENGNVLFDYYWNQQSVSKDTYYENLNQLVDESSDFYYNFSDGYPYPEIIDTLKNYE